jgi:hypothetical protein
MIDKLRDRYHRDPTFKAFVEIMTAGIRQLKLTPSEMREAAMLASIITEERRPFFLIKDGDELRFPTDEERRRYEESMR